MHALGAAFQFWQFTLCVCDFSQQVECLHSVATKILQPSEYWVTSVFASWTHWNLWGLNSSQCWKSFSWILLHAGSIKSINSCRFLEAAICLCCGYPVPPHPKGALSESSAGSWNEHKFLSCYCIYLEMMSALSHSQEEMHLDSNNTSGHCCIKEPHRMPRKHSPHRVYLYPNTGYKLSEKTLIPHIICCTTQHFPIINHPVLAVICLLLPHPLVLCCHTWTLKVKPTFTESSLSLWSSCLF